MLAIGQAGVLAFLQANPQATSSSDDPFESVSNFFDSGWWTAILLMLQVFVVLLWLALAWWTYQDSRRRFESPAAVAGCVALSVLLPFFGSIIYLIVRPPEYLDEARERELELLGAGAAARRAGRRRGPGDRLAHPGPRGPGSRAATRSPSGGPCARRAAPRRTTCATSICG